MHAMRGVLNIIRLHLDAEALLAEFPDIINDEFDLDFIMPPAVPNQASFEQFLVAKRREELSTKYLGADLLDPVQTKSPPKKKAIQK